MGYLSRDLITSTIEMTCAFSLGLIFGAMWIWKKKDDLEEWFKSVVKAETPSGKRFLEIYRLLDKSIFHIEFHKLGYRHKKAKRLFPTLHPGGPRLSVRDLKALELIKGGLSIQQTWKQYYYSTFDEKLKFSLDIMKREEILFTRRMKRLTKKGY